MGYFSYDLGRLLEPAARHRAVPADDRRWPLIELGYCRDALLHDHRDDEPLPAGNAAATDAVIGELRPDRPRDEQLERIRRALEYIGDGDVYQVNVTQRLSASFAGSTRDFCRGALASSGAWYGAYLELPEGRCIGSLSPVGVERPVPRGVVDAHPSHSRGSVSAHILQRVR